MMLRFGVGTFSRAMMFKALAIGLAGAALCPVSAIAQGANTPEQRSKAPTPPATDARVTKLEQLKAEAQAHMRAQKFSEAVQPSEEALRLAEVIYGPAALETAIAAHNLGFVLRRTDRAAEAQSYLERALHVYESKLPAVHEDIRNVIGELGQVYIRNGRSGDLIQIYQRLIARAEREGYGRHIGTAHSHNNLGFVLRGAKQYQQAEAQWERAVAIYVATASPDDEPYRLAADSLLNRYMEQSQFDKARTHVTNTIGRLNALGKQKIGPAARWHVRLSNVELMAGNAIPAREHAARALKIREDLGTTGMELVEVLNSLARADRALANYSAAEGHYKRGIAALEPAANRANIGILNDNLAVLYNIMGRYDEAEIHHKRALELLEAELGRQHKVVGETAANLGALLYQAGRPADAELFLKRGAEIAEAQSPQDQVAIAIINDNLSGVYRATGRHDQALESQRRALALFEVALSPDHPSVGTARNNFGRYLLDVRKFDEALIQLRASLASAEKNHGKDHNATAIVLGNLGEAFRLTKKYGEAREALAASIGIFERKFGQAHTSLITPLLALGRVEIADDKPAAALAALDRAASIEIANWKRGGKSVGNKNSSDGVLDSEVFPELLEALWRVGRDGGNLDVARGLEIGQWDTITPASIALAGLGARLGSGDPALAALVRERQDLSEEWRSRDKRLTEILGQDSLRQEDVERSLRERLAAIDLRLGAIDKILRASFPKYEELARPSPLSVSELQGLLRPNEAVLQFVVTNAATNAWLITATDKTWKRIPISERQLQSLVGAVRCGLDRAEWDGRGYDRCLNLLKASPADAPGPNDLLPFDPARAHGLYKILIEPFKDLIAGKELLIVPTGPLTSLPFQVLVSHEPRNGGALKAVNFADLRWLATDHALTTLPSISSLKSLRTFAKASTATSPFIGFGNPLLSGENGRDRRAWAKQSCQFDPVLRPQQVASAKAPAAVTTFVRSGLADVAELRRQTPLPETADELCAVARFTRADEDSVFLGERATEQKIKSISESGALARARVVHFATHGLLSGETAQFLSTRAEPSLMLSPPEKASSEDDGLLTASEIATLKLDADWVILSACNTATGEQGGADGLSGLSRAFFYAGARAMLVSHWAVDSEATVKLITKAFEVLAADQAMGRAEAVRKSMLMMIKGGGREAHPAYWAPFVVVGEGGAIR
jgi:CHAT domain-containing protein/tetratricopeptide (TPR) repeat protein